MQTHHERGMALVLTLFLISALSVLAGSLMFLSQTETYASMNYRKMSQTRYAAESALQRASGFLLDTSQFSMPGSVVTQLNRTVSPVTYNGLPVALSPVVSDSNYPDSAVKTAFSSAAQGSLAAGNTSLTYRASATLLAVQTFDSYGGGQSIVQTWRITGTGGITGSTNTTVEVSSIVETPKVSANSYAAFATANTCGALSFQGNVTINSYDSSQGPPTGAGNSTLATGGNVGTNGNLYIQGSVDVQGNLYTPRTGVGTCTAGAVTALTETGHADVNGSVVQLPTAVTYPVPTFSSTPAPWSLTPATLTTTLLSTPSAACSALNLTLGTNCSVSGSKITVDGNGSDVTLPSVTVNSGVTIVFRGRNPGNNVNINSITGAGSVEVEANMASNTNESVVLKIAGKQSDGTTELNPAFDLSTMSWKQNSSVASYDASSLQIVYGGTQTINMKGGNSQSAATIYAPNANFVLQGTQDLFGSILAKTITNGGNASIHYDRRLSRDFYVAGHPMASDFTWKRY
jgi:hypothetical protein